MLFTEAKQAHEILENAGVQGKIVLNVTGWKTCAAVAWQNPIFQFS
jgi:hypothetical protein